MKNGVFVLAGFPKEREIASSQLCHWTKWFEMMKRLQTCQLSADYRLREQGQSGIGVSMMSDGWWLIMKYAKALRVNTKWKQAEIWVLRFKEMAEYIYESIINKGIC